MIIPPKFNRPALRDRLGKALYWVASKSKDPLFSDLVLQRETSLWRHPSDLTHSPNVCRDELVSAGSDPTVWRCCSLWQRKLSNKLNAKRFAAEYSLRVAQLYWDSGSSIELADADLPDTFVLKTSTGWSSRQVIPVVRGRNLFTGDAIDRTTLRAWSHAVMSVPPYDTARLFAEEFISNSADALPLDYKCFVFHGRVEFVQVIDRAAATHRYYYPDWQPVRDQVSLWMNWGPDVPKPRCLLELIDAAERLGRAYEYPFVRVDFYIARGEVVFGEFTHTPLAGASRLMYTPYGNRALGRLWAGHLPIPRRTF